MSERRSYIALDWVTEEIVETLSQAIEALDAFVLNPEDVTKLRFCLTYVHQVSGSLVMIELQGASLLARETEGLISSILEERLQQKGKPGQTDLVRAALQELSAYIVKVQKTHQDAPKELFAVINSVREANHQEQISESDIFNPDLSPTKQVNPQQPAIAVDEFNDLIRKLRQTFQKGLIGIIRDQDLEANYLLVTKVCGTLKKVSANTASESLWKIAYAISEHLLQAREKADLEAKKALKQIDSEIKHLEEVGRDLLQEMPSAPVLNVLLYIIATVEPLTDAVRQLRQEYQLDKALKPEDSAAADIGDQLLATIKSSMLVDIELLAEANQKQQQILLNNGLTRLLGTFALLSLNDKLPMLEKAIKMVKASVQANGGAKPECKDIELALEECVRLVNTLQGADFDKAGLLERYAHHISQCRQGLDAIKECIVGLSGGQVEGVDINDLPDMLSEQIRQLNISPFRELAPILEAAEQYILEEMLERAEKPEPQALESLADVLTSIDYYLECAVAESDEKLAAIIEVAKESLASLRKICAVTPTDESRLATVQAFPVSLIENPALDNATPPTVERPVVAAKEPSVLEQQSEDDVFVLSEETDAEILEIFIEEGREVVEHILEYLPQLKDDYENQEALIEVRRSFHTLKGSGRMVGAMPLGDFAWSVERMLNSVRDGLAKVTPNCIAIVEDAAALVPALLDSLEKSHSINRKITLPLILRADAEWEGKGKLAAVAAVAEAAVAEAEPVPTEAEEAWVEPEETVVEEVAEYALPVEEEPETIDEELLGIFIAEAETHIAAFCQFLDQIDPGYEDVHVTSELQRALHTLKGSAHMAGVKGMASLVTPLEGFVKDLNNFQTKVDAEILALFMRGAELLQAQLELLKQNNLAGVPGVDSFIAELKALHASRIETQEEKSVATEELADKYTALLSEALDCMTESASLISEWQSEGIDVERQQELVNYVKRLSETAARANYPEVAQLAAALANYYQKAISSGESIDSDFFDLANKGHDELDDMMDIIAAQQVVEPAAELIEELGRGAHPADMEKPRPQQVSPVAAISAKDLHLAEFRQQLAAADAEMLEIFAEEAGELMEVLDTLIHDWIRNRADLSSLAEIKRILHTIKGGARLTELAVLGTLAHEYESLIENAEADRRFDEPFFAGIERYQSYLVRLIEYVMSGEVPPGVEVGSEETLSESLSVEADQPPMTEVIDTAETIMEDEVEAAPAMYSPEFASVPESAATHSAMPDATYVLLTEQYRNADKDTLDIFLEEIEELSSSLDESVRLWRDDQEKTDYAAELKRVLHTIKGGARMAELGVLGDLAHEYESKIEAAESRHEFNAAFFEQLQSCQDQMNRMVDFILSGANPDRIPVRAAVAESHPESVVAVPEIIAAAVVPAESGQFAEEPEIDATPIAAPANIALLVLADQYKNADQDTLEIFVEEISELASSLEESVSQWLGNRSEVGYAAELKRVLHTIKGGARMAELGALGDLAHDFESMIELAESKRLFDDAFFGRVQSYQDQLHQMVDFILSGAKAENIPVVPVGAAKPVMAPAHEGMAAATTTVTGSDEIVVELTEDIDAELVALFVEEAKEQLEGIESCIANFLQDKTSIEPLEELKRLLHTLKGGARLAGVRIVGDLSHDFETFIINGEREKTISSDAFIDEMQAFHERLGKNINAIKVSTVSAAAPAEKKQPSNVVPIRPGIDPAGVSQAAVDAARNFIDNFNKEQQRSNKEPVKISPEQLQLLINLAGESSIGRSRIEEQISELVFSQEEMDATVDRLHAQLRRLEIETEAQIVFRQEQVVSEGQENFDPLEMDRYTQMQQLSKSLIESASDLDDISATFTNKMRDLETLLVQQARINTELQESLMRCQMVPFSRMVPRLRRIIRQVAQELGKRIEFDVENAEGELDRSILERMVAPLEHMLRNAVDHGIEMPDVRVKAGKNPQGTIILTLSREGGEVVLTLKDDGGGINIKAVRKKAIERGLITEDTKLSDHEISQFIMHAGFSTAEKVTQISGRGVGMDVVHSEIKQMGGSLDIQSVQGQGSTFTIRLPFTVSVNRALMVCIGSDTYAIPLNTIEGIVRVSPYELEAYYQPDAPLFEYAGQSYNLRYMGTLLHHGHTAKLEGLTTPLPVVLIRSSDYSVAVQVDRLLGSREVVVKSLGPQFGMVEGLSGATVLGDGSVVIILDMLALIRADALKGIAKGVAVEAAEPEVVEKVTRVMVTDDSVTVRKVTSRLLERYGMKVILAKDGLDAITQLQDMELVDLPDIMLLDIEMPRMDGFEVLSRVRHNDKLQHIPICMITSRTGEKHRERAISLGATRYLGKPFQERELLQTISELTGAEVQQA